MKTTKSALREYFGDKFSKRDKEIREQIERTAGNVTSALVTRKLGDLSEIKKSASKLHSHLVELQKKVPFAFGDNWSTRSFIADVERMSFDSKYNGFIDSGKRQMVSALNYQHRNSHDFDGDTDMQTTFTTLVEVTKPLYQKLEDLKKLKFEVEHIIQISKDGTQAYKTLEELGINFDGFTNGTSINLPAVMQFSVSTSVLNSEEAQA